MTMYLITSPAPKAPAGVQKADAVTGHFTTAQAALAQGKGIIMFDAPSLIQRILEYAHQQFQDPNSPLSREVVQALVKKAVESALVNQN
jgi:hypothetical protein